ncbi:MAG: hypothetical protein ACREJF_08895 [Candidatus Methylomirabilales bacterium]
MERNGEALRKAQRDRRAMARAEREARGEWTKRGFPPRPEPERRLAKLLQKARQRAKMRGMPATITLSDLLPAPTHCPVLGLELQYGGLVTVPGTASLDRIDSARGYERGNVRVISMRANSLKSNATLAELEALVEYMRS